LKDKTARKTLECVITSTETFSEGLYDLHTLAVDILYINQIPCVITVENTVLI